MRHLMALGMVALLGIVQVSVGDEEKKSSPKQTDNEFLQKASTAHNAAIHFGKIGETRGKSAVVRDFSSRMVKDHQVAFDELGKLLTTRKVGVIAGLEKECREDAQRLVEANADDFDRLYLDMISKHHAKCVSTFETHAQSGESADVREYAKRTVRVLRSHHDEIKKVQSASSR